MFCVVVCLLFPLNITLGSSCINAFDYNDNCRTIYKLIMELRFNEAKKKIIEEKSAQPNNALVILYDDYIDALSVVIDENKTALQTKVKNKKMHLDALENADKTSPYYLLCKAEIELHWAAARLKLDELPTAAKELRTAYLFLKENKKKFPDFKPNNKTLALLQTLLGTVPEKYRWMTDLLGMPGDVVVGMKNLKLYLDYAQLTGEPFFEETNLLYQFLLLYIKNDKKQAYQAVEAYRLPYKSSLLAAFFAADIALRSHHTDKALEILKAAPMSEAFYPMPILYLLRANAMLYKNDTAAKIYYLKFISQYKGLHYIKEAYLRLAWCYLLEGDSAQYQVYTKKCLEKGSTLMDADKQAYKEAQIATAPHISLLTARLYCDGGYYSKAQIALNKLRAADMSTLMQKTERLYRQGRLFQLTNLNDLAILKYKECTSVGVGCECYYPAKSYLEMGSIYEKIIKDKSKASECYKQVMSIKNHSYKDSFDQQAKAGIARVK